MFLVERIGEDLVKDLANSIANLSDEAFESFVNGGNINEKVTYVDREEWETAPRDEKGQRLRYGQGRYYVYTGESIDKVDLLIKVKSILSKKDKSKSKILNEFFNVETFKNNIEELVYGCSKEKIDMILKILRDDSLQEKFLDFENNREKFTINDANSYRDYIKTVKRIFGKMNNDGEYIGIGKEFFGEEFQLLGRKANDICYPISKELKQEVLKDIPKDLDSQKTAIYIYVKLCKLLSYDQKYVFSDIYGYDDEYEKTYREETRYTKNVTTDNNLVICHDFNIIFTGILRTLGINAEIKGLDHSHTEVNFDKNCVKFDSTHIDNGKNDMLRAKLGEKVEQVSYRNDRNMAEKVIDGTYQLFGLDNEKSIVDYVRAFEETREKKIDAVEMNFFEVIQGVLDELKKNEMADLSALLYIDILKKNKFFGENIEFSFVGRKEKDGKYDRDIMVKENQGEEERYYLLNMKELTCKEATKQELNKMFGKQTMVYQDRFRGFEGIGDR